MNRNKYVITLCGISLIYNTMKKITNTSEKTQLSSLLEISKKISAAPEKFNDYSKIYNECLTILNSNLRKAESIGQDELCSLSAEINSLIKFKFMTSDKLHFLYTDTPDCMLCATIIKDHFTKLGYECSCERVQDLNIFDAQTFEKYGVRNLLDSIIKIVDNDQIKYEREIIINSTCGFKSATPFLNIIAQTFNLTNKYVFENSGNVITVPPIPVKIDFSIIIDNIEFFNKIKKDVFIKTEELKKIFNNDPEKISAIMPLLYDDGNECMLSGIGELILKKYERSHRTFYMHEDANSKYETLDNSSKPIIEKDILKLFEPEIRSSKMHPFVTYNGDYFIAKTSGGSRLTRIIYYFDESNENLYIRKFYIDDHQKYEKEIPNLEPKFDKNKFKYPKHITI